MNKKEKEKLNKEFEKGLIELEKMVLEYSVAIKNAVKVWGEFAEKIDIVMGPILDKIKKQETKEDL